jgi:hypothetical protein
MAAKTPVKEMRRSFKAVEKAGGNVTEAAKALGIPRATLKDRLGAALKDGLIGPRFLQDLRAKAAGAVADCPYEVETKLDVVKSPSGNNITITYIGREIKTVEELLEDSKIDTEIWEPERVTTNNWPVSGKINKGQEVVELVDVTNNRKNGRTKKTKQALRWKEQELWKVELRQVKVTLRRKSDERQAIESLLAEMSKRSPKVGKIKRVRFCKGSPERALEICIMDPHLGMRCHRPHSDHWWSMDRCEEYYMWALDGLLQRALPYGPFKEVVWVFGNDYLHADNVFHTTTQGTPQPECEAWHTVYERGVHLAIAAGDRMKQVAPLRILQIPGNHDRQSSYTLGWVLWAYYHADQNVIVEKSATPYRFWKWGCNLIGFDHRGKNTEKLASLMANECSGPGERGGWWDTSRYREWHLGDQHRKGSGKPVQMTEQGVGVEFLTGLTPANEWHKINAYSWQQRGAVAYVWDKKTGPEARLHINLDSYTGQPMGE